MVTDNSMMKNIVCYVNAERWKPLNTVFRPPWPQLSLKTHVGKGPSSLGTHSKKDYGKHLLQSIGEISCDHSRTWCVRIQPENFEHCYICSKFFAKLSFKTPHCTIQLIEYRASVLTCYPFAKLNIIHLKAKNSLVNWLKISCIFESKTRH